MICRACGGALQVIDTRDAPGNRIRRRRRCLTCRQRWTTYEALQADPDEPDPAKVRLAACREQLLAVALDIGDVIAGRVREREASAAG